MSKNSLLQNCRIGNPLHKNGLLLKGGLGVLWNCFGMWASFSTRVEFMDWSSRAYLTYTCLKCIISPSWATVCHSTFVGGWLEGPSSPCTHLVAACTNRTGISLGSPYQNLIVLDWGLKDCKEAKFDITLKLPWINWALIKWAPSPDILLHLMLGLPRGWW